MNESVHPTAIVSETAVLGKGTTVGPYSIIGPHVVMGQNNRVGPHAVITGHTTIGDNNEFFQFCSVGEVPQDLKYRGEDSRLEIGDGNLVREYVTLQPGTADGGMITKIGNQNLFMASSHIAHDCIVGNKNIFANSAAIAGHVTIGNGAAFGGLCAVHQFVRVGDLSYTGGGSMVAQDVPPFTLTQGDRAKIAGLNLIGLKRAGKSAEEIKDLKEAFRTIFMVESGADVMKDRLRKVLDDSPLPLAREFAEFIQGSERGVMSLRKKSTSNESTQ